MTKRDRQELGKIYPPCPSCGRRASGSGFSTCWACGHVRNPERHRTLGQPNSIKVISKPPTAARPDKPDPFTVICPKCRKSLPDRPARCSFCGVPITWSEGGGRVETLPSAGGVSLLRPWHLAGELRAWQNDALEAWEKADFRGVVEAATGTGKTMVALGAIARLHGIHGDQLRVAIVVPTKVLAAQWRSELMGRLRIPESKIGEHFSDTSRRFAPHHQIVIAVINSARARLSGVMGSWGLRHRILIVDECHRAGSESNAVIFDADVEATLGLSATPERDDGGHERVYQGLGRPVYRYTLLKALEDGVLADVRVVNLYVDFTDGEHTKWDRLTDRIRNQFIVLTDEYPDLESDPDPLRRIAELARQEIPAAMTLVKALSDRRGLLATAQARRAAEDATLQWLMETSARSIVFHETIDAAVRMRDALTALGVPAGLDHSQLDRLERDASMSDFRKGTAQVLVAVRSLDEGVDVPDAVVAFIAAGGRSKRQRIQRMGRVLRKSPEKNAALVITIMVRGTPEEGVGARDAALVGAGRVRNHRWPGVPVADAIELEGSYRPVMPMKTFTDFVSELHLGLVDLPMRPTSDPVPPPREPQGGYSATEVVFSPNAWHDVALVRSGAGMPPDDFDRIRPAIRRAFYGSLEADRRDDDTVVHGSEIDAIRRRWHSQSRR